MVGEEGEGDDEGVIDPAVLGGEAPDLTSELERLAQLESEIYDMAGRQFKITSFLELSRVLFEDLKLPVVKQPSKNMGAVSGD
jgi:DNA polymerase I